AREAVPQALEAAATQGYFSAQVDVAVDRKTQPATVTLTVIAGPPTLVSDVRIAVAGPAQKDVIGSLVVARIERDWGLPIGEIFRQPAWTAAKTKAVTTLAAS